MFRHNKHVFVAASILLSSQKTCFVTTNTCLSRQAHFCRVKRRVSSQQTRVCRGKHTFVESKDVFRHNKHVFVATKMIPVAAPANDEKDASHDEKSEDSRGWHGGNRNVWSLQQRSDNLECQRQIVKPVLNWANVCSPNILRTVRRTMIRFLIELLVRRIWLQSKLYFILNWLVMRCKLRPELAADAQQTA